MWRRRFGVGDRRWPRCAVVRVATAAPGAARSSAARGVVGVGTAWCHGDDGELVGLCSVVGLRLAGYGH